MPWDICNQISRISYHHYHIHFLRICLERFWGILHVFGFHEEFECHLTCKLFLQCNQNSATVTSIQLIHYSQDKTGMFRKRLIFLTKEMVDRSLTVTLESDMTLPISQRFTHESPDRRNQLGNAKWVPDVNSWLSVYADSVRCPSRSNDKGYINKPHTALLWLWDDAGDGVYLGRKMLGDWHSPTTASPTELFMSHFYSYLRRLEALPWNDSLT